MPFALTICLLLGACGVREQPLAVGSPVPTSAPSTGVSYPPTAPALTAAPSTGERTGVSHTPTTAEPYPPPATLTPEPVGATIPPCSYPLVEPVPEKPAISPALDAFRFSEPQVILEGNEIIIADWSTKGDQLLITRSEGELFMRGNYLEILNPATGAIQRLAPRIASSGKPFWIAGGTQIAYADSLSVGNYGLRTVAVDGATPPQDLLALNGPYINVNPAGDTLITPLADDQTQLRRFQLQGAALQRATEAPITLPQAPTDRLTPQGVGYMHAWWSPGGQRLVLANEQVLYLSDPDLRQPCTIDLGNNPEGFPYWAYHVNPSPNGRYLAIRVVVGAPPHSGNHLLVDLLSGAITPLQADATRILEVAWSPDGNFMFGLGIVGVGGDDRAGIPVLGFFLLDARTGKSQPIMPKFTTLLNAGFYGDGGHHTWSLDGSMIITLCDQSHLKINPLHTTRLCRIDVEVQS